MIGATLDRNGLRPGRWLETRDGWVVLASETGVLDEPPENILRKGRLQPGKLFLVDLEARPHRRGRGGQADGRDAAAVRASGIGARVVRLERPARRGAPRVPRAEPLRTRQLAFGYTQEDMKVILAPLARNAEEAIGSMGNDLAARRALRPAAAALLVLQAAVRAGHEPADRLDPRGGRDERRGERRLGAQPARRDARARAPARDRRTRSCATRSSRGSARSTRTSSRRTRSTPPGRSPTGRPGSRPRVDRICARGRRGARRRREHPHPLRPRRRARARADPGAARRLGRAPPPRPRGDAAAGGARRRVGRAARACTLRDADRLRRRRGQPVPDARDARRARRRAGCRRA